MLRIWAVTAAATLAGAAVALFTLVSALTKSQGITLFAYHPALMYLSMALVGPAAVCAVQARKATKAPGLRAGLILGHASMQLTAAACAAAGFYSIYINKERYGRPHFTSRHSWLGLAALGAYSGAILYASVRTTTNKHCSMVWKDVMHRTAGVLAVGLGAAAVTTGILHDHWTPPGMTHGTQVAIAATSGMGALTAALGYALPASPAEPAAKRD